MKPGIALLIAEAGKGGQKPQEKQSKLKELLDSHYNSGDDNEEVSEQEQYKTAMADFVKAVKDGNVDAACEAFTDVMKLCPETEKEDDEDYITNDDHHSGGSMEDHS